VPVVPLVRLTRGILARAILIGLCGLVLAGFLALVSMTLWEKRAQTIVDAARTRENLTRTLEEQVVGRVREVDLVLTNLAYQLDEQVALGPLDAGEVQRLLSAHMHQKAGYADLAVFDSNGNYLADATGEARYFDARHDEYFTVLRDQNSDSFHISLPYLSQVAPMWSLSFSRRLRNRDGSFGGIVLATIDLTQFENFYASLDVGRDGNITLWDGTASRVLSRHPANLNLLGRTFDRGPLYEFVKAGLSEGTLESVSPLDGVDRMLTFRRIPDMPLVISVAQAEHDVMAEWRRDLFTYSIAFAFGAIILVSLTGVLLRQFAQQQRLVEALRGSMREAETASRTKTEFLACVSHELRTPLNAVIGFAELISTGITQDAAKIRGYALDIHASGQHLLRIIGDILDMSRVEAGMLELHEEEIEIEPVIATCLRQVEQRALDRGVALRCALTSNMPIVRADKTRLTQTLLNLLSNGVKFTGRGGSVSVDATIQPDGSLAVSVSDSGIGMTEEELAIAMEPFRQVDSRLARHYDGTGLGLPLAKAFAELHGGKLLLDSVPGRGTIARIIFPPERVLPCPIGKTGQLDERRQGEDA
jgi:two-component system, cell cycle sensor histidine kinase PleC